MPGIRACWPSQKRGFQNEALFSGHRPGLTDILYQANGESKEPRACDFALYCERNLIERFFNKLKQFRAIATRYDKLAEISSLGSNSPAL